MSLSPPKVGKPAVEPASTAVPYRTVPLSAKLEEPPHWPVMLRAAMVGLGTGLIGTAFQAGVQGMGQFRYNLTALVQDMTVLNWLLPMVLSAVMVAGALWLVRSAPEAAGSGIQEIEGTLEGSRAFDWRRLLPIKFLGGILALGSGMVLGREGPTVHLGGSIGKMMAEVTKIPANQEDILIAAGAGAGIAVAFNAPLAGIIFVMEEIRHHFLFRVMSFRAIMLACITGDIVYRVWMGQAPDIQMEHLPIPPLNSLWLFLVLGIFLGVVGYFFNYFLIKVLDLFGRLRSWQHLAAGAAVGGLVGLAGWQAPHFTGGGYDTIAWALTTKIPETTLFVVFLVRFGATLVCYGTGSPGGIFAPMLAIATVFSLWFGYYVNAWFPELVAHPQMFAVAGMAALFAASVRAPLTGIVLAVEMTMNYTLILPLLVTCLVSAMVAHRLGGQPIYAVLLQRTLDRAKREQARG